MIQKDDQNYDHNHSDRLEHARTTDSAVSRELTPKPVQPNPEARRARGMARGLTLLTVQRDGEFRLGVKTGKGILDVTEAATLFKMHAPAAVSESPQITIPLNGIPSKKIRPEDCAGAILKNNRYHIALLFDNIRPRD